MKCKRKMQKRRDILTILGMLVLLNVANSTADADWRVFLCHVAAVSHGRKTETD